MATAIRLHRIYNARADQFLDAGHGECLMRDPRIADLVQGAMLFFDGVRYDLIAWTVMPNHTHAIFTPRPGFELEDILHSWKSFTSHQTNKILSRSGVMWQPESYDHLIRGPEDLKYQARYIAQNAAAAGLSGWRWSGCRIDIGERATCAVKN